MTTTPTIAAPPIRPEAFRCPRCGAEPDQPCRSPQPHKIARSHQARQDSAIRAQRRLYRTEEPP